MSILISDDDYKEYRVLQDNAIFQQKLNSARGMNNVEYDIDIPIRTLVAMFALLGCEPLWSCCGFDYDGQPTHKTHEYGGTFVCLNNIERSQEIIKILMEKGQVVNLKSETDKWETWTRKQSIYLRSDFDYYHRKWKYPWSTKSCIHYPELALIKIDIMEKALIYYFKDEFADKVILSDTNKKQKIGLRNWQYPILEDWAIRKDDIFIVKENNEND